jgi:hypothetical protein
LKNVYQVRKVDEKSLGNGFGKYVKKGNSREHATIWKIFQERQW